MSVALDLRRTKQIDSNVVVISDATGDPTVNRKLVWEENGVISVVPSEKLSQVSPTPTADQQKTVMQQNTLSNQATCQRYRIVTGVN